MYLDKFGRVLLWAASLSLAGQVVPGWFVLELAEAPAGRVRGERRVRAAQAGVRSAMAGRMGARARVRETTEVVMNSLIVQTDAGSAELASLPGVQRVWPVYRIQRSLDRAAILHQVTKAWEAIGGAEKAGAGVRIGILDSGLDLAHPGFKGDGFTAPEGFPKGTTEAMQGLLNGKVIVYRSYDSLLGNADSDLDNAGHGSAVAMAAAGLKAKGPLGEVQGMAPGAYLGIYKIFGGPNGDDNNSAMALKAIDDAVADGMDVLNLSWGTNPQARPEYDPLAAAVATAAARGVQVVKSIGNYGPVRASGSAPSSGAEVLAVGASWTDRVFLSGIRLNDSIPVLGLPGTGPVPEQPVKAKLVDVIAFDSSGLGCTALPDGALSGVVALVQAGECTFELKLTNVQAAGAVGAVVFAATATPNAIEMDAGNSQLPAVMIRYRDGATLRNYLATPAELTVELVFTDSLPFLLDADGVSSFSSRGPGPDGSIQPDLLAVGEDVLTAAQKNNPNGDIYDPTGFAVVNGSSFSAPIVTGAYALLKAARPGLTAGQYRSLLVNTALPFPEFDPRPAPVQVGGAGRLDVKAALNGRLTMNPVSVSYGFGGQTMDATRSIRIQNVSGAIGSWKVEVDSSDEVKATVEPAEFSLGVGDTIDLRVRLSGNLQTGEYQGFLLFRSLDAPATERPQRVPYWYGVPSGKPASATPLPSAPRSAAAGETLEFYLLVTDQIGAPATAEQPKVTVAEGSGSLVRVASLEPEYPGYWLVRVKMGAAVGETNRFRIEVGSVVREVVIRSR